jgi:transcriptional regulator
LLVLDSAEGPTADHMPLEYDATAGPHGTLRGHVARANPLWQRRRAADAGGVPGPQAYVTPGWYPSKREHGKVVPTWNYTMVHARGPLRAVEDAPWLRDLVGRLTDHHEAARTTPWAVDDAPDDYVQQMLRAIVGIEIELTALVGKWKVSQNRADTDRAGVAAGMADAAPEMARLVAGR